MARIIATLLRHGLTRVIGIFLDTFLLATAIGVTVNYALVSMGFPSWAYYACLLTIAGSTYVGNSLLIHYYIKKLAPEFASKEEAMPGMQKWELTAGVGIVPKWVSWIGLIAVASLLAMVMPALAAIFR